MHKSIVQQLNGLAQSTVVNRSFIQTTATDDIYDMRKSRINNLPNYKKQDLSGKLNFVVVFQGIQIERLSVQVEALRIKLKDAQRQIFNNGNYEVQIRQLSEKCVSLQMEREQYRQQIQKMNMISQKLYEELEEMKRRYAEVDFTLKEKFRLQQQRNEDLQQEIQKWKARMHALEISKNKQMEDLRNMLESQRKSMIDRQIRQQQIKFDSQRSMLEGEIRKIREAYQNKNMQINRLRNDISRFQVEIQELRQDRQKMHEYQSKIALISQQTIRLNELLRARQQQIDRLRNNEAKLQHKISANENLQYQFNQLENRLNQRQNQLSNLMTKISRLEQQNRRFEIQVGKIPQYERLLDNSGNQIERLNHIIRDKIQQNDHLNAQYQSLEVKYKENKQQRLPQLENKVNGLVAQNDRINGVLQDRLRDLQEWKNRCLGLQKKIDKFITLESQKQKLEDVIRSKNNQIQERDNEIHHMEQHISKLQGVQNKLASQQNKNKQMFRQIQRLNNVIRGKVEELQNFNKKVQNYQRQISSLKNLENQLNEHRKKSAFLTKELDRINGVIVQKTREIQQLKEHFSKIEMGLDQSKKIEKKLQQNMRQTQQLIIQLDEARKETDFFQQKLIQAQNEIRRAQNQVFSMNQQKEQLNTVINQRKNEIQQIKIQMREKQNQIRNLRQLQVRLRQLQNKNKQMQGKYQELQRKHKDQNKRAQEAQNMMKTLNANIEKIKKEGVLSQAFITEFMNVKRQCEQKDKQFKNLEGRFQAIERIMKALRGQLQKQVKFGQQNQNKWVQVGNTINGFGDFMRKSINMQNQLARISQDNVMLQSSARMANFQLQASSKLSTSSVTPFVCENSNIDILKQFNDSSSSGKGFRKAYQIENKRSALEPITKFQF